MGARIRNELDFTPHWGTTLAIIAMVLGFILVMAACNAVKYVGELDPDSITDTETESDSPADAPEDSAEDAPADEVEEAPECYEDADCDDADECTIDTCASGVCEYEPVMTPECHPLCTVDEDCDDGDECTIDTCEDPGYCFNEYDPGCSAECTEDFHCDDGDLCTADSCVEGVCVNEFEPDIVIEVVEDSTTPTIRRGAGQQLLKLRFTSTITMAVDQLTFYLGADCSGDGIIDCHPTLGEYEDTGGHCGSDSFPSEGLWNDFEGVDLVRDIEVRDATTGATLMGPIIAPIFASGVVVDDGVALMYIHDFDLTAGTPREVVLVARVNGTSTLRANLDTSSIIFVVDVPVCRDLPPILQGLPRPVVE